MTTDDYRRALDAAIREYEALGAAAAGPRQASRPGRQTIGTLSRLCGLVPTVPMGLTDACRLIVRGAGVPVTPTEVRDRLHGDRVRPVEYSNDLAAIHTDS